MERGRCLNGRKLSNILVKNLQHSGIATLWKTNATPRYYCLQCGLLHKTLLHTLRAHGAYRSSCRYVLYWGRAVLDLGSMTVLRLYNVEYRFFIRCIVPNRLGVSLFLQVASFSRCNFLSTLICQSSFECSLSTRIFCWSQCLDLSGFGTLSQKASNLGWLDGGTLRKDSFSKQVLCLDDWVERTHVKAEIHYSNRFIYYDLLNHNFFLNTQ